ncbi:pseudouridine synthase [Halalkalibacter krulwichiae]|uniref:Pseudouridine synthase n=1 Tax=Halalkalibacter krulwichiae TaxID=199441 RepID=A0A1X9MEA7_9BACI|nr:pseudouridine synthase [Halalkalibacter krulwichiae]ARK31777.1 Ribosomal small subunit pseudouridine synthase A [Halalkalibacter krulwichiae]
MRIDKLLANMGYGTRKDVKKLLKSGGVHVNGETIKEGKKHINTDSDLVTVYGEEVEYKPYIYLMLNKPQGVISATEDLEHETVIDLLLYEHAMYEPFPVGRLDKDTEGFLLITNDGQFSHALMSPKKHVPKTYIATVKGMVTDVDVQRFKEGVTLDDGYVTKPGELKVIEQGPVSEIELTITEGKYHQVKRMFEAVEKKVLTLKRTKIGKLTLDPELELGTYRELRQEEIDLILSRD